MVTISEINQKEQEKLSAVFDSLGVFFAFNNQQYCEKKKEGVEYVNMGLGMLAPKANSQKVREELNRIHEEKAVEFREQVKMDDCILYELANHEAFYTGDYCEVLEIVQSYYPQCTMADVKRVYDANVDNYD